MSVQSFQPMGNTICIIAATSPPTPANAIGYGASYSSYRIVNTSNTTIAFLGYGPNATVANANAVIATANTAAPGLPIVPGADEVFTFGPSSYFTAITANNTATLYITPGEGM